MPIQPTDSSLTNDDEIGVPSNCVPAPSWSFLHPASIEELAKAQGVKPYSPSNGEPLFSSDEEMEEFVAEIYEARKRP